MNHKVLVSIFVSAIVATVSLQGADKKEKDLPPGLQKKDKLPPGWEKKQGTATDKAAPAPATPASPATPATPADPKTATAVKPATPATPATPARSAEEAKASVEKRIRTVNGLDEKSGGRKAVLAALSRETGVAAKTLENQREEHPKVGAAGILIANEIAAQTKRPARVFYRQHEEGKSWAKIAADNNVNLDAIDAKLSRVEMALKTAGK